MQHKSPGQDKKANWLNTPDGPFVVELRIYWPEQAILDWPGCQPGRAGALKPVGDPSPL